ncbi:NADH-quinone oxidoreductase subunit J [Halorutilales archaeon Cl-col2-1]
MERKRLRLIPGAIVTALFVMISTVAVGTPFPAPRPVTGDVTYMIGTVLFDEFLAAFEIIDMLLVAALIGGLYLAKRDKGEERDVGGAVEKKPMTEADEARENMETTATAKEVKPDGAE